MNSRKIHHKGAWNQPVPWLILFFHSLSPSVDLDIIGIGEFKEEENICPGPQSFVTSHKLRTSIENGNQNLMGIRVECSDGTPLSSGNLTSGAQYEPLDCPNGYNAATIHQLEMVSWSHSFIVNL